MTNLVIHEPNNSEEEEAEAIPLLYKVNHTFVENQILIFQRVITI